MEEEISDISEEISEVIDHSVRNSLLVGFVSLGIGLGIGYLLGRRNPVKIHVIPERQPFSYDEMEEYLDQADKQEESDNEPEEIVVSRRSVVIDETSEATIAGTDFVAKQLQEAMTSSNNSNEEKDVQVNIFTNNELEDDWDFDEELKQRSANHPYVLTKDEFYENEKDYSQITLTYYEGDNIVADEEDHPVYNFDQVIGPFKFGHGSGDPKIFYVRNDKRHAEYEIVHDPGLFSVEVLGLEIEDNQRVKDIKHSNVPKFRLQDE